MVEIHIPHTQAPTFTKDAREWPVGVYTSRGCPGFVVTVSREPHDREKLALAWQTGANVPPRIMSYTTHLWEQMPKGTTVEVKLNLEF